MGKTLANIIQEAVTANEDKICVIERELYSRKEFSYSKIYSQALRIASFFSKNRIKKGDKIVIYLPNSSDYASLLWACALSGVIAVPVDFNATPEFAEKIYEKINAKRMFCSVFKSPIGCRKVYIEEIESLYEYNAEINKKDLEKIKEQDIFEIVFTSGTTSDPKGVMLTHRNLAANIDSIKEVINFDISGSAMLSVLPLSHLFEQNIGFFLPISLGAKIVYISSRKPSAIIEAMKKEKIGMMVTVPFFLESFKNKIISKAGNKSEKLMKTLDYFKGADVIKPLLYRKIRKNFPNLKVFIVGGTALDKETESFWRALGYQVIQGYGLTETSPVLSCNRFDEHKESTVGKPLKGVKIKIKDNEITAIGDNVFKGYYRNKEETEKTLKNGWIYTGDLGKFDEEGFLQITGRKKNVIISPSGLNIYPEDIEQVLNKIEGVKESVVLGLENGKRLVGIILPAKQVRTDSILKEANSKLPQSQILSKVIVWPDSDFPRTPTLKVIRRKIEEKILLNKNPYEKTSDRLIETISRICEISPKKITENSKLVNLGLDSVRRIELVTEIEELFSVEFDESLINEKTTVAELRKMISSDKSINAKSGVTLFNSLIFNPIRILLQRISFIILKSFCKIKVTGAENLPNTNCIIIANHSSMLDTFVLYSALPLRYRAKIASAAAKDFFFKNWFLGFFGRLSVNAFGFSRKENTKQSLKDFGELMSRGLNVLIYPEGTRSRTGKLLEFKEGIGVLAWNIKAPVIPIKLKGLHEILPVGKFWPKPGKVEVVIGKPLKFSRMNSPSEITSKLHEAVKKL